MPKYSIKRKANLVPHFYNTSDRNYNQGAWKNWPINATDKTRREIAFRETASFKFDRGFHRFTEPYIKGQFQSLGQES